MDTQTYERIEAYLGKSREDLSRLKAMWEDPMVQLYNDTEPPQELDKGSVFLAGPTSRNQILHWQWRAHAVWLLRHYGLTGWIFCPEPRGYEAPSDFTERAHIHTWESKRLLRAERVLFWIPRKADELLGLNTNLELGIMLGRAMLNEEERRRLMVGWPHEAERIGLPNHYMEIAASYRYTTLEELCQQTVYNMS